MPDQPEAPQLRLPTAEDIYSWGMEHPEGPQMPPPMLVYPTGEMHPVTDPETIRMMRWQAELERKYPSTVTGMPAPQTVQPGTPFTPPMQLGQGMMPTMGPEGPVFPKTTAQPTGGPQAPPDESGGWIQFGEGFAGGPERFELPKGGGADQNDMIEMLQMIRSNPAGIISGFESWMGQQGMHESQRLAMRTTLAEMMGAVGVDPGATLLYAQEGARALPQISQYLSRQAQARAEESGQMQRFKMGLMARGQGALPASTQKMILEASLMQAKQQKKRAAVVILPNGEVHVRSVNKPGWKIFEVLRTKKGSIDYAEKAFADYLQKGKELPNDITFIDLSVGRGGAGGMMSPGQFSMPNAPTAPGGPQVTEDEYGGVINTINRRRGR